MATEYKVICNSGVYIYGSFVGQGENFTTDDDVHGSWIESMVRNGNLERVEKPAKAPPAKPAKA